MGDKRVAVSSGFDENTIRAIARGAHERGLLARRAIRDQTPLLGAARALSRLLPSTGRGASFTSRQTVRAESGALPEDVRIAPAAEFARILGARKRSFLTHSLGNARCKVMFDRVAQHIDFLDAEILVSMPGASLETFRRNKDRLLILHEIDAHPRVRNELLEHFYGARFAKAEMYPEWFVQRIEDEFRSSDRILVPGTLVADQMRAQGIPAEKILQVPYGVDPTIFRPSDETGAAVPTNRRLRAVCTAQVSLRKGIPFLLEAVRGQPIDLTLVGTVFDSRILSGLPDNVTVAGPMSATQLAALYAKSDVFVLPSVEDCFSLVVAEAAGAGLPVITTRQNGAHEVLSDEHTVLDAGDSRALRDALANCTPLTYERRLSISKEATDGDWTDWDSYAAGVLKAIGATS